MIFRCKVIRILCGVKVNGCTNSSTVSILSLGIHTLSIQVQVQVVIKERRIEVQSSCDTLEVRGLDDTLLICITYRNTIREIFEGSRHRDIVIMAESSTIDFILPVRACCTKCLVRNTFRSIHILNKSTIFIAIHHVKRLLTHTDGSATGIRDCGLGVLASFLGCDNDDTIRTTATIDSSSRSILQNVERLNVLRIDHRKGVGKTLHTFVIHCQTINNNQRVVRGIQ